jgi:hypothetical protein
MEPLPEILARLEALERSLAQGASSSPERKLGGTPARAEPLRAAAPVPPRAAAPLMDEKKKMTAPAAAAPDERPSGPVAAAPASQQNRKPEAAVADPVVQKAVRLFDGRIISGGE